MPPKSRLLLLNTPPELKADRLYSSPKRIEDIEYCLPAQAPNTTHIIRFKSPKNGKKKRGHAAAPAVGSVYVLSIPALQQLDLRNEVSIANELLGISTGAKTNIKFMLQDPSLCYSPSINKAVLVKNMQFLLTVLHYGVTCFIEDRPRPSAALSHDCQRKTRAYPVFWKHKFGQGLHKILFGYSIGCLLDLLATFVNCPHQHWKYVEAYVTNEDSYQSAALREQALKVMPHLDAIEAGYRSLCMAMDAVVYGKEDAEQQVHALESMFRSETESSKAPKSPSITERLQALHVQDKAKRTQSEASIQASKQRQSSIQDKLLAVKREFECKKSQLRATTAQQRPLVVADISPCSQPTAVSPTSIQDCPDLSALRAAVPDFAEVKKSVVDFSKQKQCRWNRAGKLRNLSSNFVSVDESDALQKCQALVSELENSRKFNPLLAKKFDTLYKALDKYIRAKKAVNAAEKSAAELAPPSAALAQPTDITIIQSALHRLIASSNMQCQASVKQDEFASDQAGLTKT